MVNVCWLAKEEIFIGAQNRRLRCQVKHFAHAQSVDTPKLTCELVENKCEPQGEVGAGVDDVTQV